MNKERLYRYLFAAAGLLTVGLCVRLAADYFRYTTTLNSAPFWVTAVVRMVEFLLPAAAALIAGLVLRRKTGDAQARTQKERND